MAVRRSGGFWSEGDVNETQAFGTFGFSISCSATEESTFSQSAWRGRVGSKIRSSLRKPVSDSRLCLTIAS
ncbi:MAG: hypothetical protein OEQ28_00135 [Acidobacteriota bacterium]|nr:hypothetical protein [Acidobacteriota bacterium]